MKEASSRISSSEKAKSLRRQVPAVNPGCAIPPRGATLVFEQYRHGGGVKGNVDINVLNTLKTSIPFIDRVANRMPAEGGLDQESLEAAMLRVPAMLRSRERAVNEADYEFLAKQAFPNSIGRVKCLQPRASDGGKVLAQYSNGQQVMVAQLAMASIRNPESLIASGNNNFQLSAKSATPAIGIPGTGGRGSVIGGALEFSTVDIAREFTNLIVLQRGYQANSKVVTTVDQMSQDTINLKQ